VFEKQLQSTAVCTPCASSKLKRNPFPRSDNRASAPLERLHVDIAGPFQMTPGGKSYYFVLVDDYSGYKVVTPLTSKDEAAGSLITAIVHLERKYKAAVAAVRFERDRVFLSNKVQNFFSEKGIQTEPTSGYSPPENGHAERAIGALADIRDAQMADAGLKSIY
jgi:hypothetical protein